MTRTIHPEDQAILSVRHLVKYFPVRGGFFQRTVSNVKAVDDISFDIRAGETFGLVGESGCGKTTVGQAVLCLTPLTSGEIIFNGIRLNRMNKRELKATRRHIQLIFQDPYGSLDPRKPIGETIAEGLVVHQIGSRQEQAELVAEVMEKVGLRPEYRSRYPHEFSGGQRQRIAFARSLVMRPRFIVCDEPVSALDVSIQSQILNLLRSLQQQFHLTYLFIAHNLSVVKYISDRIAVMYLGKIVEIAPSEVIYRNALHPYTQALVSAIPVPDPSAERKRLILSGDVPSPIHPPQGCRFHTRCPFVMDRCRIVQPVLEEAADGHQVACHLIGSDTAK